MATQIGYELYFAPAGSSVLSLISGSRDKIEENTKDLTEKAAEI